MTTNAKLIGLPELEDWFEGLEDAAAEKLLGNAALAGALPILNAAKTKAPKRTRNLSRSLHSELTESRRDYAEVEIGTDVEYAAIHEYGGVISPKNAKFLAIPVTDQARQFAGGPRSFPSRLHAQMSSSTSGVLIDEGGNVQYALKKSVTIPARPYLRPALDENEGAALEAAREAIYQQIEAVP